MRTNRFVVLVALMVSATVSLGALLPKDGLIGDIDIEGAGLSDSDLPPITVYWNGLETVTDENGIFRLPLDDDDFEQDRLRDLSLLVCKRFVPVHDNAQTIRTLEFDKTEKAAWYDLVREQDQETKKWSWQINRKEIDPTHAHIPENCIVVCVSSKHVLRVEDTGLYAKREIFLPRIVVSAAAAGRQALKGVFNSIANRQCHKRVHSSVVQEGDATISQLDPI